MEHVKHEWIKVMGIVICHWCGVQKKQKKNTNCKSTVKMLTKSGKLKVIYR